MSESYDKVSLSVIRAECLLPSSERPSFLYDLGVLRGFMNYSG